MAVLGLVGVLLAFAQVRPCPDCRAEPRRVVLCTTHSVAEASALRDARTALAKADAEAERIAVLERVAALTAEHPHAPSPSVARFLAGSVGDPSLRVRRRALALLVEGQNREEAVRGVLDGWKLAQKAWRVLDAKLVLGEAEDDNRAPVVLTTEDLHDTPDYIVDALRALGHLGDERTLTALVAFLRSPLDRTPGRFLVTASEAALEIDSRRALEAVITLLEDLEGALVEGGMPRRFGAPGRTDLLAVLKAPLENANEHDHADLSTALEDYAELHGLELPSSDEPLRANDWRSWFRATRDRIPDRVPIR